VLARYRLLGLRVPDAWLAWVERDLSTPGWLWRQRRWGLILPSVVIGATFLFGDVLRGDVSVGDVMYLAGFVVAWVFFAVSARVQERPSAARERMQMLSYQRGEGPHPWRAAQLDDGRGGPFWLWIVGALALAAVITILVRVLT
jgi:hypothetical protein